MKRKPLRYDVLKRRALKWYSRAATLEREQGAAWYATARAEIQALATDHHTAFETAAAVVAVLSPMVRWEQNIDEARLVLARVPVATTIDPVYKGHGAFPVNVRKAWDIARGMSADRILSGPKVRSFYLTLVGAVAEPVIDSVMVNALVNGEPTPFSTSADAKATFSRPRDLRVIVEALKGAALELGIPVHALQATVWLTYRNMRDAL